MRVGIACLALAAARIACAEPPLAADADEFAPRVAAAIKRALPLVQKAAANYPEHRKCFSCHHQTLPMLAVVAARHAGFTVDANMLETQAGFTHTSFTTQLDSLRAGQGIGGKGLTVGYGLWALDLANSKPSETTTAMVTYLLKTQKDDGHWEVHTSRPPLEESFAAVTALAVTGLRKFAAAEQQAEVEASVAKARAWLATAPCKTIEDRTAKLWAAYDAAAAGDGVAAARKILLDAVREDGGWSQLDEMPSDAYATGQAVALLCKTGLAPSDAAVRRGALWLLNAQGADGSWHVKTRTTPVQVYFDNGDPHGKDQFISTPATCWAIVALALVHGHHE